jgi:hypothetical protein
MNQQESTLTSILGELATLRQENAAFRQEITTLHNHVNQLQGQIPTGGSSAVAPTTTRRGVLRKLAAGLLVGVGAATALGSNPPTAEAKLTINPVGNGLGGNVGALAQLPGYSVTGTYAGAGNFGFIGFGNNGNLNAATLVGGSGFYGVYGEAFDYGVYGRSIGVSGSNYGVYGTAAGSSGVNYGVYGDGQDFGVYGRSTTANGKGVTGINAVPGAGSGTANYGVQGVAGLAANATGTYAGVYGECNIPAGSGALAHGVYGKSNDDYGVYGESLDNGVAGRTNGTTSGSRAIYGIGNGGSTFAGYFVGNVFVTGTINKAAVGFKIDHPLHPDSKYLVHTSIESPDMLNLYNGLATLDETGEAVVTLPDWFEALNRDFRYQLTSVGVASPSLYIAQEIAVNSFKIAGGVAGQKVSWQLTGIRQDAYANAYRMPIEQDKDADERGLYLHPELFDKSADLQIGLPRKRVPVAPVM